MDVTNAPTLLNKTNRNAKRLARAVKFADDSMKPFRLNRLTMIRQFAGPYYSGAKPAKAEPLNSLYALVQTLLPTLSMEPKSQVTARNPENQAFAEQFALAVNRVVDEIRLEETLDRIILDAFFGPGLSYTGLVAGEMSGAIDLRGYHHDPDEPFCEHVSLDNYIPDPFATAREGYSFEGHRFRVPFDWAMEQRELFDRAEIEKLGKKLQDKKDSRVRDISLHKQPVEEDWLDQIELISLWLPSLQKIVILPTNPDDTEKFIGEAPWDGGETGPYDLLSFMDIPDNVLPLPTVGAVYDLHLLMNAVFRKMKSQAERQKDIGVYDLAADRDADTIRRSSDGEMVGVTSVDRVKTLSLGGPNKAGYEIMDFAQHWANRISGNTDAIGGLQKQSNTLGQDEMLWSNASAKIGFWRKRVLTLTRRIMEKIGYYVWTDPVREMALLQELPGGMSLPYTWSPKERRGVLSDYIITASPYGIQSDTPERKYQRVVGWVRDVIAPLAALGASQGAVLDVGIVAEVTGQLGDIPRAGEMFSTNMAQQVQQPEGQGGGETTNVSMGRAGREPARRASAAAEPEGAAL